MIPFGQCERLYLQREGAQSISTDLPVSLPQHQLDGIRFLFRQFKKKVPGVILNDPSGYGKQLQVALFLNALLPTLKKPVLILSNSADDWKDQFEKWTNCSDDIAVESANPYTAKTIFINPVQDGVAFSRRSWGVVVLHDEGATRELLRTRFNADYKIWVTASDLKEDLNTLASIYDWLYPNQKFNVSLFTAKKNNWRDVVEKALLLDAFVEDFLVRRTDFLTPFYKPKKLTPIKTSPVKATRKNKDPTGTKVKRSKKRIIDDDDDNNIHVSESTIDGIGTKVKTSKKRIIDDDDDNNIHVNESTIDGTIRASSIISKDDHVDNKMDMDVESFIRNEEAIQSEGFNFINETSQDSITVSINVSESMDIDFSSAVKEIVEHEKSLHVSRDEDSQYSRIDSKNHVKETDNEVDRQIEISTKDTEENTIGTKIETKDIDGGEKTNCIIAPATEESQNISNNHDTTFKRNIIIPETESENTHDLIKKDNLNFDVRKSVDPKSNDWKIEDDVVTKNEVFNDNSLSINGGGDKGGAITDNTNFKTNELVKKKTKVEEFDAELAEIEARALNKLKGSILDSLF